MKHKYVCYIHPESFVLLVKEYNIKLNLDGTFEYEGILFVKDGNNTNKELAMLVTFNEHDFAAEPELL